MTIADLIAQHATAMGALNDSAVAEIEKHSAKMREVIGDPYAAYRALRNEPAAAEGEEAKPTDQATMPVDPSPR